MTGTLSNRTPGARARRGAGNEPKRKRAREEGCQRAETQAASPSRSGRNRCDESAVAKSGETGPIARDALPPWRRPGAG